MIRKRTMWILALGLLAVVPLFAYAVKGVKGSLDALTFTRPELRVSATATDAEVIQALIPNMKALDNFRAEYGTAWSFTIDERTGRVTLLDGGAIPFIPGPANDLSAESFGVPCRSAQCVPVEKVEALARDFLKRHQDVFLVDPNELVLDPIGSVPVWDSIYLLRFQWAPGGVPVEGGSVFFRINNGNLLQVATKNISSAPLDPLPTLSRETAWEILQGYLGQPLAKGDQVVDKGTLRFVAVTPSGLDSNRYDRAAFGQMIGYRLTYRLAFTRPDVIGTWEGLVDAHSGELLRFVDANRYGHIHGGIRPSDGIPPEENRPFPFADTGLASPNNYSDGAGNFPGLVATSSLTGKYAHIVDACGGISNSTTNGDLDFLTDNAPGTDCVVPAGNPAGAGNTHSSRTLFYNLTAINLKAQIYNPSNTWLTSNFITANVNGGAWCNATSGGGAVNFYQHVEGSCNNLGEIPGVAMHEWAHSYDSNDGSGGQSPPLETYSDWTAIIQTHNSCTGAGFLIGANCDGYGDACTGCTGVRDCDYTKHAANTPWKASNHTTGTPAPPTTIWGCGSGSYDGPCGWEDHCESGISTQALWDFVYTDLPAQSSMDLTSAWMLEDRLWFAGVLTLDTMYTCSSGVTDGCTGYVLYTVMRALDDDGDGTANGTPHAHAIYHALDRHEIDCSTYNDSSPQNQNQTSCPSLNTPTLSASTGNNQSLLTWTTGGANATRYFVYRNESSCDVAFTRIAVVDGGGTLNYTDNGVVNGTAYYYRVQAVTANDSCTSPSSNCVTVTPQPCTASVSLDRTKYSCNGTVNITVLDSTPGVSPWTAEVWSTTDATHRTVTLANTPAGSATYTGSIQTTTGAPGAGQVQVANGDTLTARFTDPDSCGTPNVNVENTAVVDCAGPVISNVLVTNRTDSSATITWTTDEAANSRVTYGTATPPGTNQDDLTVYTTSHSIDLTGLTGCMTYYFSVTSTDEAANSATDNSGGTYYSFVTLGRAFAVGPEDVETGTDGWTLTGQWHADTCKVHGGANAFKAGSTTCPGTYNNSTTSDLTWGSNINLGSAGHGYHLRFWEYYQTESGWDYCRPQISTDGGTTWTTLGTQYAGTGTTWTQKDFDLAAYTGSTVRIRFQFYTDSSQVYEGWYLDDIEISKPQACGPELHHGSHSFADVCSGTGAGSANGVLDAGEDATVQVTLSNTGSSSATGVSATLSTSTPGVTVTDNAATYPDIAAGGTGASQANHYSVRVDPSVACGTTLNFTLNATSAQGSWSDAFTLTVGTVTPGTSTPINEAFTAGDPPTGWTRVNGGTGTQQWTTTNPGARTAPAGITTPFEIIDGDFDGSSATQDDSLITPAFDCTGATAVSLAFDTYYNDYDADDFAYVDVSADNGATWTTHTTWSADVGSATTASHQVLDITALAGTATQVMVRFHYVGSYGWYWLVDNVRVDVTAAGSCAQDLCTPVVAAPKPVPDGRLSGTAMTGTKVTVDGGTISITYDTATCTVPDHSILYGNMDNVAALTLDGGVCSIANASPYSWTTVPTGYDVFWVIVGDGGTTESSWGEQFNGTAYSQRSTGPSGQCGNSALDTTGTCP